MTTSQFYPRKYVTDVLCELAAWSGGSGVCRINQVVGCLHDPANVQH